jgi:hypothetical protein
MLRLYERDGIDCLNRLNGMFAIAIDDAARTRCTWRATASASSRSTCTTTAPGCCSRRRSSHCCRAGSAAVTDAMTRKRCTTTSPSTTSRSPGRISRAYATSCPALAAHRPAAAVQTQRWWSLADQQASGMAESEWIESSMSPAGRRHPPPPAFRCAFRRLPFRRCRFQHRGGHDEPPCGPSPSIPFPSAFTTRASTNPPLPPACGARFGTRPHVAKADAQHAGPLAAGATWHCDQPHGDASPSCRLTGSAELAATRGEGGADRRRRR